MKQRRTWAIILVVLLTLGIGSQLYSAATQSESDYATGGSRSEPNSARLNQPTTDTAAAATTAPVQEAPADEAMGLNLDAGQRQAVGAPGVSNDMSVDLAAPVAAQRLVIKSATVEAEVEYEQLGAANSRVELMIARLGGYIVSNDDSSSNVSERAYVVITFRVPAAKFDEALRSVEGDGIKILRREISGQDVTEEFTDNESQIRNLEATADRLRTFLEKAATVTEAIQVNRTLSEYEGQIEVLKGRQKYLSDSAAMSLIALTMRAKPPAEVVAVKFVPPPFSLRFGYGWDASRSASRAWAGVVDLGRDVADFLIAIAVWTPVWLPLLLVGLFIWSWARRVYRRISSRTSTASPAVASPAVASPPVVATE
ncbi:MAG: DUF4349 domain-containing protein [Herpetosiphonaceae bacterium]|nr:DUF4349 domain-containing protein [Herpetosiphonaceae bacterium]